MFIDRDGMIHLSEDRPGPRMMEVPVTHVETERLFNDVRDLWERGEDFLVQNDIDPDLIEAGEWHWSDLIKAGYQVSGTIREPAPQEPETANPSAAGMNRPLDLDALRSQMNFVLDIMDHLSSGDINELKDIDPFFRKRVHEIVAELYARGRMPEEAATAIRRELEASEELGVKAPSAGSMGMRP